MRAFRRASLDGDLRAVHVHLTVADLVEPSPGQQSLSAGSVGGDLEVVLLGQRAATDDGLDHFPGLAFVVRERDLARPSAVTGTASNVHLVGLPGRVVGHGVERVIRVAFAGIIRS